MSMPWYITVVLFLFSPAYAILVREKFWPRFQDWWASRSKRSLKARIETLERMLADAQELALLTEAEDAILQGIQWTYFSIGIAVHFIVSTIILTLTAFNPPLVAAFGSIRVYGSEATLLSIIIVNIAWTRGLTGLARKYRLPRTLKWRLATEVEIKLLQEKLR
jgi:hypothetical protein